MCFTDGLYDCDGIPAQDSGVSRGHFTVFNQRGVQPVPVLPRERERHRRHHQPGDRRHLHPHVRLQQPDHTIVDNGDGTITITVFAAGAPATTTRSASFVLKDPGTVWFSFALDYNGTPGDPSDDTEIPDSFQLLRPPPVTTTPSDRDFCADLAEFAG